MSQYSFLWKGKDPQGNFRGERVTAENADVAKAQLLQDGWTELELVTDEVAASAGADVEAADWIQEEVEATITPTQESEYFEGKVPGVFAQLWKSLKDSKTPLLIFGALLAWGIYSHRTWSIAIGAVGIGFLVLLVPALHLFFSLSLRRYSRLNRAKVWGRWDEVLDAVESLCNSSRLTRIGVGEVELARCRAQALAGSGRLEEAVAEFKKFENSDKLPRFMYLSHLSSIYDVAKAFDKSLECRKQALEDKPDNSALWIDLAYGHVRGFNEPAAAREALKRAEQHAITGLGKAYLPFLYGVVCWREGNFQDARQHLEKAVSALQPWTHNDLTVGLILLAESYLCAVHGALRNHTEAKRLFRKTEKFLIANREDELLEACRRGIKS